MTPNDVLKLAKEKGALIVDLRFIDMPGLWQHFSIPVAELTADLFAEGIGFDGSSIRGFQAINESDMLLFPDPDTAQMDPFTSVPTLVLICDVKDPVTGANYTKDPRYVAKKAEAYVKSTGIAAYAKYQAKPSWALVGRYEYVDDTEGGFMLLGTTGQSITVTSDHLIAGALKARLEYRTDFADEDVFPTDDGTFKGSQTTLTLGLVYTFAGKI